MLTMTDMRMGSNKSSLDWVVKIGKRQSVEMFGRAKLLAGGQFKLASVMMNRVGWRLTQMEQQL